MSHDPSPYAHSPRIRWFGPQTTSVTITEDDHSLMITVIDPETTYSMAFEVQDGRIIKTHDMGELI